MYFGNNRIHSTSPRQTTTLVRFDSDPALAIQNPFNNILPNVTEEESSSSSHTRNTKPINYIQELFIENFVEQRQRHYAHPDNFAKLFIFPFFTEIPKTIEEVNAIPSNKSLPISIFYHSDKYLKKCLSKLRNLRIGITPKYQQKYIKWSREALKAQKSVLYSIFLIYSQTRDYNSHSRYYRLWIPGSDHHLSNNYYSEYVFFSAQALLSGITLPQLEEYSGELQNRALDLYSSLNTLYQVLYHRMEMSLKPPYADLVPYLNDFDKFWLLFEKRLYTCYHNIYHINRIKSTQMMSGFQKFMIKTLVYSIKKNYFTIDMAYEYDPLIMISLPRLTFVYIIYHLSNPFFFSNFPWFSKERLTDIDKINQTFNLLNRKSIEKLELYLIHGIPNSNNIKRKNSISAKKLGKRNSTISTHSNKDNMILPKDINNDSPDSPDSEGSSKTSPQDTTLKNSLQVRGQENRLPAPLVIPNFTNDEHSPPSSSINPPTLTITIPCSNKEGKSLQGSTKEVKDEPKSSKTIDEDDELLKTPLPSSSTALHPSEEIDINQKLEVITGEGVVGSPREEEDWSFNNEVDEAEDDDSSDASSSDEDETIGDILIRKVFKSVCMIVDEFQSSEVAIKLNSIMRNVFEKGIEKIENMREEDAAQVGQSSSKPLTTSKKVIQNKLAT